MKFRTGSYANVASTLALVVALGGTSYAAVAVAKNSVGSPQIINSSVKSADVKNGGLKAVDFKAGELPAGAQGPAGPTGATGATGATGPAGSARAYGLVNGGVGPTLSMHKGFTGVARVGVGLYCLSLPGFDATTTSYVVSVDWGATSSPEGNGIALVRRTLCGPGNVGVSTERIATATSTASPADNVSFTVMVP